MNPAHCSGLIPLQATTHAPDTGSHAPLLPRQPSSAHAHSVQQELPFLLRAWLIPIQFSAQQRKCHFFRKPSFPVSPALLKEGRDCPESMSAGPRSRCVDSEPSTHLLSEGRGSRGRRRPPLLCPADAPSHGALYCHCPSLGATI